MEKYNYYKNIYADVKQYISDNIELSNYYDEEDNSFDLSELSDELNDKCWISDSVTGNASGSYTFNRIEAAENLAHNWDLMKELADNGLEPNEKDRFEPEVWDVCVRCYLLPQVIADICEELKQEVIPAEYGKEVTIW